MFLLRSFTDTSVESKAGIVAFQRYMTHYQYRRSCIMLHLVYTSAEKHEPHRYHIKFMVANLNWLAFRTYTVAGLRSCYHIDPWIMCHWLMFEFSRMAMNQLCRKLLLVTNVAFCLLNMLDAVLCLVCGAMHVPQNWKTWEFDADFIIWLMVWNIFYFPINIGNVIIPTDELIFFRGAGVPTTNQSWFVS